MPVQLRPRIIGNAFLDSYQTALDEFKRDDVAYINILYEQYLAAVQQDVLNDMFYDSTKIRFLTSVEVEFELYLEQCLLTLDWRINDDIPRAYLQGEISTIGEKNDVIDFCKVSKEIIRLYLVSSEETRNKILRDNESRIQ